ncbi:MAG: hypothetical protein L0216_00855 [Planctomycetales bacterium]|nr:hypothetical protein [Planctomycetales bacterium]
MRRLSSFAGAGAIALAALAGAGCNSDWAHYTFDVDEDIPEQTIPGSALGGTLTGGPSPVSVNFQAEQEYQQQDFDNVDRVIIKTLTLAITANSTNPTVDAIENGLPDDWSFLTAVDIFIEATVNGAPSSERVAFLPSGDAQFAAGNTTLNFQCTRVDVLPYFQAPGGYKLRISATGSIPPDDVIFNGRVVAEVTVSTRK